MPDLEIRVGWWLAAAAVAAVALTAGWYTLRPGPQAPVPIVERSAPPAAAEPARITVHVAGAVVRPGLVSVPEGARVADVVIAAGGARPEALLSAVNLAAPVRDGDRIEIPTRETAGRGGASTTTGVDLNRDGLEELQRLPGVGPVLAARIVAYREAHGPFATVEDLLDVPGIGEAKLARMRDGIAAP